MVFIILDESGTLSINNRHKYFVIAGYICKDIRKVKFIYNKVKNNLKESLKNKIEIKATDLNVTEKAIFINQLLTLNDVKLIGIYINAKNPKLLKNIKHIADKYNFLTKVMLNKIFENIKEYFEDESEINFRIDERQDKGLFPNGLEQYLKQNWKLCNVNENIKLNVKYLDSKTNLDIQMADYIANIIFVKKNYPEHSQPINFINDWELNNKLIWDYEDYHNKKIIEKDEVKTTKNTHVTHINLVNVKKIDKIKEFKKVNNNVLIENIYQKVNFWTLTHYKNGRILIQGKEIIELIKIFYF
ncbi:DUF3800 domain-containing protein [Spiroplasma endosymbiont of Phycita roborella]|uniref:DUF3800 domain-containing protein n=1 Tax=Spiroplasma endosymbiont of Phycita roborella TaxID=3066311 RepID=UPI00313E3A63